MAYVKKYYEYSCRCCEQILFTNEDIEFSTLTTAGSFHIFLDKNEMYARGRLSWNQYRRIVECTVCETRLGIVTSRQFQS